MTEFVEKVQIVGADGTPLTVNADGSIDVSGAGGGGAPADAQYYVAASDPTLSAEIVVPAFMQTLLDDTDAATARSTLGVAYSQLPGYEFGYDQITTNVTISSTTEASGTTIIACAAHTFDGSPVVAQLRLGNVLAPSSTTIVFSLFEGATQIGWLAGMTAGTIPIAADYRFTPTAASHTYTVTAYRIGGSNGTVTVGSGGTSTALPGFIRFIKV